jgi:hypothetical protein
MKDFAIRPRAKPIISAASRATIESYFVGLISPSREKEWLDAGNRYKIECTQIFEGDVKRALSSGISFSSGKRKYLTAYIGASAPTHVIDGWSFLGRALDSSLRGDTYSAAHFAYYAELRAAMALLASEGIGIFSRRHAVVGVNGITPFPRKAEFGKNTEGTHKLVWPVFRFWSSLRRASDLLDALIQPEQVSLSTWLSVSKTPVFARAVGQRWFSEWGIDLGNVREDHDIRNLASYRPSQFRYAPSHGAANIAEFVTSLWQLFEPGTSRRFPGIERHLLKRAWQIGGTPPPSQNEIERIGLTSAEARSWVNFFSSADKPLPLALAESATRIEDPTCHLRMISRAALLLFVASGSTRLLLQSAGYSADTISFWWKEYGQDRGLWEPHNTPDDPLDAWADVSIAIDDLVSWRFSNEHASLRDLRQSQPHHIDELGAFELVGIWSLLP